MELESRHSRGLMIGALIGAVLGAGTAYLLMTAPTDLKEGEEPKPVAAKDLLGLARTAASLIRKLDDIRRRT